MTQLQIDFAFGFTVEQWLHVRIEQPFSVLTHSGLIECDPETPPSVAPLLGLHQTRLSQGAVYKDGSMILTFDGGYVLQVPAGKHYEAFSVTGSPAGAQAFRFISLPGGGLAEWVNPA